MRTLKYKPQDIGKLVRETRKGLGVTQKELALTSGTGLRFIIELEKGKETAEFGKVLTILQTLGVQLTAVFENAVLNMMPWLRSNVMQVRLSNHVSPGPTNESKSQTAGLTPV